jgi:hypothetical protein
MFIKYISHKEVQEILNDKYQNNMAFDFITKYLLECRKRNKRLIKQTNEMTDLKEPVKIN